MESDMRFSMSGFFDESVPPWARSIPLGPFQIFTKKSTEIFEN